MVSRALAGAGALSLGLALGCSPELDAGDSLVTGPRLLAIRSTPAEAKPKDEVTFESLYVDPSGPRVDGHIDWAFCLARKPLAESGAVSPECLSPAGPELVALGVGPTATGPLPDDACRLFGPDLPEPLPGEPPGRPADPDGSGGYYQPARARVVDESGEHYVVASPRLVCGVGGASPEVSADLRKRYRANENPSVLRLLAGPSAAASEVPSLEMDPSAEHLVAPGATTRLALEWPDCPVADACGDAVCGVDEDVVACAEDCQSPRGCGGSERYLAFDPKTRAVSERREGMLVSWYTTAGSFEVDRTGRTEAEATAPSTENTWVAPEAASVVLLWVVLRDERGGVGWSSYRFRVSP